MDELGRILQRNEMEKSRRSDSATEKRAELTEHQMALRARVRGIFGLVSSTRCNERMEFVILYLKNIIHMRRFMVLMTKPA